MNLAIAQVKEFENKHKILSGMYIGRINLYIQNNWQQNLWYMESIGGESKFI